ncbi:MAG TPA: sigma 54-interacting transcriptional regulator [Myxococcales bacterium]|nr:sigma 54-interacting transcriptional regulator [Myxococcales bacterium]
MISEAGLRLFVIREDRFSTHPLPQTGHVIVGSASDCDIVVGDSSVAPRHARLEIGPPSSIEDLGSGRVTQVGATPVPPGGRAELVRGGAFQLGGVVLLLERVSGSMPRRILSRDYFDDRVQEECYRAERNQTVFSLLRISVPASTSTDSVEQMLGGNLRLVDVVACLGPSEYGVLLCETPPAGAEIVAARLRERFGKIRASPSLGIAFYPRDGNDAFSLIARAAPPATGSPDDRPDLDRLPESSPAIVQLRRMVERVAGSDLSILILGETGVGKERMAEELHRLSPRSGKPLMRLNCAALNDSLLESELFGHERGAFTGAHERKIGLLEATQGGTVLLDEVGDMPLPTQVKLLRVLEERQVRPVGSTTSLEIDVRFVSATNRNLEQAIARGTFREDLYFRLNGITLVIPPLRDRPAEIEDLARHFIAEACRRSSRAAPRISREALQILLAYPWPGNIRELRSVIERAVVLCDTDCLMPVHLPEQRMRAHFAPRDSTPPPSGSNGTYASRSLSQHELARRDQLVRLLREHRGNVTAVGRALQKARFQVQRWLKRYDIDAATFR